MGKFGGPTVADRVVGAMGTTQAPGRGGQRGSGTPQGTHAGPGGPKPKALAGMQPGHGLGTPDAVHKGNNLPKPPKARPGNPGSGFTAQPSSKSAQPKGKTQAGYGNTSGFADSEM